MKAARLKSHQKLKVAPRTLKARVEGLDLVASLYAGDAEKQNPLLFCLPGGGAAKGYFDLTPELSFARLMNGLGYDVITMDHLGTASNALPKNISFLHPREAVDYLAKALTNWTDGRDVIGVGHSMGGMMITLLQARHTPFKAIALLGSNAGGLEWGLTDDEKAYIDKPDALARDLEKLTLKKFGNALAMMGPGGGPSGKSIVFGAENETLLQALRDNVCELYTPGGMMSMVRGSFPNEVKGIQVPIFFAFGDHDIGISPHDAPKAYVNAKSHKLILLKNTGHNHFGFSTTYQIAVEMHGWSQSLG